ncbi:hypothetical protein B0A50_03157 [Salinomyces thailandicus]|uniref:Uncharacterized protein n=1 Tax=Salinomyces thailandicus TaxID=706561 RepID=A0A4U0U3Z0_9PEZI|nr:hypothetical protein B0A50_03157 [Salinomyces thailandica]
MPSLEESRRQVREELDKHSQGPDHNDILASLQDEIDKHNAVKDGLRDSMRSGRRHEYDVDRSGRSMRFRFKSTHADPRKRKHRSKHDEEGRRDRKTRRKHDYPTPPEQEEEPAHPFPREPAHPDGPPPADAFRDSLFDALADDEGAHYWESVYSQPIHIYPRPSQQTQEGGLEAMSDEEYVQYVKTKMWAKKHPEIVHERAESERKKREREEERTRAKEDFVRQKERAAWERAERRNARRFACGSEEEEGDEQYEKSVPRKDWDTAARSRNESESDSEYTAAWSGYLAAWDELKQQLASKDDKSVAEAAPPSKRIPWPVLGSKPVLRANIEAFIRRAPAEDVRMRLQVLKAERVRWHPDKIQQRFGGDVDDGTMKLVTGVFQVVDAVFEEVKKTVG